MQKLNTLLSAIIIEEVIADVTASEVPVMKITDDSRQVEPGSLFVAVRGPINDGHKYIDGAIEAGATAVVAEELPPSGHTGVTLVKVANSAVALGYLASQWYDNPSRKLRLVGVTGTNGKTTIATLLYRMAMLCGEKAGLLSTVENRVVDKVSPAVNTTPSPLETNRLLKQMVDEGCTFAAMEVSSHGMVQNRTAGLHFAGGVFTNLTRDHLDYHGTFKAYIEAKKSFFTSLSKNAFALVNDDDRNGSVMVQNTLAKRLTYGLNGIHNFVGRIISDSLAGMELAVNGIAFHTPFIGRFNAYNLTAVFGTWVALGHDPEETALALSRLRPVAGRFMPFSAADGTTAIIDYAHTPDALENVLTTIRNINAGGQKVYTIVGAGGDRDKGKRPLMGGIAARLSDVVVVTSDNPRNEDPAEIASQVLEGAVGANADGGRVSIVTILDRAEAIARTIADAPAGSIILIAGKGHETYQEFENKRRIHFDDCEEALAALNKRPTPTH